MGRILRIMPVWSRIPGTVLTAASVFALGIRTLGASPPEIADEAAPQNIIYPSTDTPYAAPLKNVPHATPPASPPAPVRSEQLEAIARQADRQTRHGFELAGRGAYYAARSEFITSLRLVAQGLDAEERTTRHGKALAAGLTALKEADDFIPRGAKLEADLDLPSLIGGHATPVLKDRDAAALTPLAAMKAYLTFAQRQLAEAAGHEMAGAMALHALGKLHEELARQKTTGLQATDSKAVVFYQAALTVCPESFMTANDLGVLLAKNRDYDGARTWLERGAALTRSPTVWNNLAAVYERLGRNDLAARARQQVLVAQAGNRTAGQASAASGDVRWVGAEAFGARGLPAETAPATPGPAVAQPPPRPVTVKPASAAPGALTPWQRDSAPDAHGSSAATAPATSGPMLTRPTGSSQPQRPAAASPSPAAPGALTPWQRDAAPDAHGSAAATAPATSGPMLTRPIGSSQPQRPAAANPSPAASGVLTPWQRDAAPPVEKTQDGIWR
jgi:tetratricopeptide (TPR) repeat protein